MIPTSTQLPKKPKHSGPRKRRSKKKKIGSNRMIVTLLETCKIDTHSDTLTSDTPNVPPLSIYTGNPKLRAEATPFTPSTPHSYVPTLNKDDDESIERLKEQKDRLYWTQWAIDVAEKERARRLKVLKQLKEEEEAEIKRRREWAIATIEKEKQLIQRQLFLDRTIDTPWFQSMMAMLQIPEDYEIVCPNSWVGCNFICIRKDLEDHLKACLYRQVPDVLDSLLHKSEKRTLDLQSYDVVCPNAVLGCTEICSRGQLAQHLAVTCPISGTVSMEKEWEERKQFQQIVIAATEQERRRRIQEQQEMEWRQQQVHELYQKQTRQLQIVLHQEIELFAIDNSITAAQMRETIPCAIEHMRHIIRCCWEDRKCECTDTHATLSPDTLKPHIEPYGSYVTGMYGNFSDVDLVVFHVANTKVSSQHCVQRLADFLSANVSHKSLVDFSAFVIESISAITHAKFPLLKVVLKKTEHVDEECDYAQSVHFDITFDDPNVSPHDGVATAVLVNCLIDRFYGLGQLNIVLKYFLAKRDLNDPYMGGLSSYGLFLMITHIVRMHTTNFCPKAYTKHYVNVEFSMRKCTKVIEQQLKGQHVANQIISNAMSINAKKSTSDEQSDMKPYVLGKMLMDFLYYYGTEYRLQLDEIRVLDASSDTSTLNLCVDHDQVAATKMLSQRNSPRSPYVKETPHSPCLIIRDPLQECNNVGKTCFRANQLLRDFSDCMNLLTTMVVRGRLTPSQSSDCVHQSNKSAFPLSEYRILSSIFQMIETHPKV
uniref:Uncharacterized protein AlNc14C125G6791 n=1 Tax=Albugo laibachii Nc14 TaxID=890382 RepID=F0WJR5_9STRA|nr:conserved hypothetical protein [Albugo laibachii Nc14]|eukprot:CCA21516.1 conserved hypothetical protein [Albugo laibachii Nc14]